MSFNHKEELILSFLSPQHVQIEVETTSTLHCTEFDECERTISPFRSDILELLVSNPLLTKLRWYSSSLSSNSLSLMSKHPSPSGVHVMAEFRKSVGDLTMLDLLKDLIDHRILLAPLESISQRRLHRYMHHDENTFTVNLPMDGSITTSEALLANLPDCGLLGVADADSWSNIMLGSAGSLTRTPRKFWMEISRECSDSNKKCLYVMKQGVQYGKQWSGSRMSIRDILPGPNLNFCPWTSNANVKVVTPKSITPTILGEESRTSYTDFLLMSSHKFPTDLSAPFVQFDEHSSWSDITYARLERSIYARRGVAYGGILKTTIENLDSYEAQIKLFSFVPNYIKLSQVNFSIASNNETYHQLDGNSFLLEHDFVLPPMSKAFLTMQYDPTLLPFQLFPPDPNRGNELTPTWALWNESDVLYTHSQLLMPPVPDMSMPFNVISLTCTFYVFIVGSIINTLVRKGEDQVYYKLYPEKRPKSIKEKLKEKVAAFKIKVGSAFSKSEREKED